MNETKARRKKHRLLKKIFIIFLIFMLVSYLSNKIKIDEKYLNLLSDFYVETKAIISYSLPLAYPTKPNSLVKDPIVYIYNTHQSEKYQYQKLTSYNIDYDVVYASYMLGFYLEDYDVYSKVETASVSKVLSDNNLSYPASYVASRKLLDQSIIDAPSLKYFFDLHRDATTYEISTCEIDNKKYAKVLFVIGLEHDGYEQNLIFAENLSEKLKRINPCLTRGISKKEGVGVDGIYNQDFNSNTLLIEIGSQYNLIEEVNNTLKVLASVIAEYIYEG